MLAYLFWHRADEGISRERYEAAQHRFHRSLATHPPAGLISTARFAAEELPWLGSGDEGYEDWYLVADWTALGVLREAAVAVGHHSAHDAASQHYREGAGAVYRLVEGQWAPEDVSVAVWVAPGAGRVQPDEESLLLGDGLDGTRGGLWRRELVLGPAPEYCLLAATAPAGADAARVPRGWRARTFSRAMLSSA